MYRAAALVLVLVAVVVFAARLAEEPVQASRSPRYARPQRPSRKRRAGRGRAGLRFGDLKIGSFEAPERVPEYEVLEESTARRNDVRAARLLIDTRSREEEEFVLITRDLKSRYFDYDAVSVEFTDTEDLLFYNDDPITRTCSPTTAARSSIPTMASTTWATSTPPPTWTDTASAGD